MLFRLLTAYSRYRLRGGEPGNDSACGTAAAGKAMAYTNAVLTARDGSATDGSATEVHAETVRYCIPAGEGIPGL